MNSEICSGLQCSVQSRQHDICSVLILILLFHLNPAFNKFSFLLLDAAQALLTLILSIFITAVHRAALYATLYSLLICQMVSGEF